MVAKVVVCEVVPSPVVIPPAPRRRARGGLRPLVHRRIPGSWRVDLEREIDP